MLNEKKGPPLLSFATYRWVPLLSSANWITKPDAPNWAGLTTVVGAEKERLPVDSDSFVNWRMELVAPTYRTFPDASTAVGEVNPVRLVEAKT